MNIDFDSPPYKYWSSKTKINYLQRQIIIHSILYYKLDCSCILDKDFDKISQQLKILMSKTPKEIYKETDYWYCMYDFDGSTGFDIPDRLNKKDKEYLRKIAMVILESYNRSQSRN